MQDAFIKANDNDKKILSLLYGDAGLLKFDDQKELFDFMISNRLQNELSSLQDETTFPDKDQMTPRAKLKEHKFRKRTRIVGKVIEEMRTPSFEYNIVEMAKRSRPLPSAYVLETLEK
jgi:hypothetical protein